MSFEERIGGGRTHAVQVLVGDTVLDGDLCVPTGASGLVLFAHGSGSGRRSVRNRYVAGVLQSAGLATLLFDLLTHAEESRDQVTAELRFDLDLLARRVIGATDWVLGSPATRGLRIGYFGASTGAGAALIAAAERPDAVAAVVSRGGRPDLAGAALSHVRAPTLLIVGSDDRPVIGMNQRALTAMDGVARLEIVAGASHLFEEHGALERVASLAAGWFREHLGFRRRTEEMTWPR